MGQNFDLVLNLSNYRFFRLNFSEAPFLGAVRGDEDFSAAVTARFGFDLKMD